MQNRIVLSANAGMQRGRSHHFSALMLLPRIRSLVAKNNLLNPGGSALKLLRMALCSFTVMQNRICLNIKESKRASISSGHTLWSNPNLVFWFSSGDKICAYRDFFEKRVSYLIDAQSGEILEEDIDARALWPSGEKSDAQPGGQFPESLEESADKNHVLTLLKKKWNNILSQTVEYLENIEYWMISFYIREEERKGVSPYFGIMEKKTGTIVYSIKLGEHYPVPVPDLFFKVRENLYYIEHQHSLHAVELWKS